MTKLELHFKIGKLNPDVLQRLGNLGSTYGILRVALSPQKTELTIEFDATRLQEKDVEAVLARTGVPVEPMA